MNLIERAKELLADLEGEAKGIVANLVDHLHLARAQAIADLEAEVAKLPAEQKALKDLWSKLKLHL